MQPLKFPIMNSFYLIKLIIAKCSDVRFLDAAFDNCIVLSGAAGAGYRLAGPRGFCGTK